METSCKTYSSLLFFAINTAPIMEKEVINYVKAYQNSDMAAIMGIICSSWSDANIFYEWSIVLVRMGNPSNRSYIT